MASSSYVYDFRVVATPCVNQFPVALIVEVEDSESMVSGSGYETCAVFVEVGGQDDFLCCVSELGEAMTRHLKRTEYEGCNVLIELS